MEKDEKKIILLMIIIIKVILSTNQSMPSNATGSGRTRPSPALNQ